jgi:hypothetical protein
MIRSVLMVAAIAAMATPAVTAPRTVPDAPAGVRVIRTPDDVRNAILEQARSYIGVREASGRNDGPEIERWLNLAGAFKGDPWCAAFVFGCGWDAGYAVFPRSAWSPDMVAGGWKVSDFPSRQAAPASAFGIFFPGKGRVAHTGLIESDNLRAFCTIEGNTNGAGSREGDGVYRKFRLRTQVYMVRDWIR